MHFLTHLTYMFRVSAAFIVLALLAADKNSNTVLGYWREPTGSVIRIAPCGSDVCATLMAVSQDAPETMDRLNPDPAARSRPLCGLVIGAKFHLTNGDHADGGTLYDPKSGKTYHGEMTANGDKLALRGYVGFRLFGRTETWVRTGATSACHSK